MICAPAVSTADAVRQTRNDRENSKPLPYTIDNASTPATNTTTDATTPPRTILFTASAAMGTSSADPERATTVRYFPIYIELSEAPSNDPTVRM